MCSGICLSSHGIAQTLGVHKLNNLDGSTASAQAECLKACQLQPGATGCQVVWDGGDRGCYYHSAPISHGGLGSRQQCWIFSKCTGPAVLDIPQMTWNQYTAPLVLNQPSVYRLTARSVHSEMMNSAAESIDLQFHWPHIPDLVANVLSNGEEVSLQFWTPGITNTNVSYQITQLSEEWTDVVVVGEYGLSVLLDNATLFNQMFNTCPVVQYVRNGAVVAVYVRTSSTPAGFDAHQLFTYTWTNQDNMMGQNFDLYDTLDEAISEEAPWEFCNYNNPDVGFPRDCGKYDMVENRWFSMPSEEPQYAEWRFNPRGVDLSGLKLQIFSGSSCPVHASLLPNRTAAIYEPVKGTAVVNTDAFVGYFTPGKYQLHATATHNHYSDSESIKSTFEIAWRTLASPIFKCNSGDCGEVQQRVANISISASEEAVLRGFIFHVPFKLSPLFPTVALKSARSGKYCSVESSVFTCNSDFSEAFTVEDSNGKVALRLTSNGQYCVSDDSNSAVLKCNQDRLRCVIHYTITVLRAFFVPSFTAKAEGLLHLQLEVCLFKQLHMSNT